MKIKTSVKAGSDPIIHGATNPMQLNSRRFKFRTIEGFD